MFYKIITLLFCVIFQNSYSQIDFDNKISEYKNYELNKIDTLINLTSDKSSKLWLNLLPSVSYNYNAVNNSYYLSVGINFNSFASFFNQKQRNKIEREKLRIQLLNRLDSNIDGLYTEYEKIQSDSIIIALEEENLLLSKEIYLIKEEQYNNNKINLEQWILEQQKYNQKVKSLEQKKQNYNLKINRFLRKVKSPGNPGLSMLSFPSSSQHIENSNY